MISLPSTALSKVFPPDDEVAERIETLLESTQLQSVGDPNKEKEKEIFILNIDNQKIRVHNFSATNEADFGEIISYAFEFPSQIKLLGPYNLGEMEVWDDDNSKTIRKYSLFYSYNGVRMGDKLCLVYVDNSIKKSSFICDRIIDDEFVIESEKITVSEAIDTIKEELVENSNFKIEYLEKIYIKRGNQWEKIYTFLLFQGGTTNFVAITAHDGSIISKRELRYYGRITGKMLTYAKSPLRSNIIYIASIENMENSAPPQENHILKGYVDYEGPYVRTVTIKVKNALRDRNAKRVWDMDRPLLRDDGNYTFYEPRLRSFFDIKGFFPMIPMAKDGQDINEVNDFINNASQRNHGVMQFYYWIYTILNWQKSLGHKRKWINLYDAIAHGGHNFSGYSGNGCLEEFCDSANYYEDNDLSKPPPYNYENAYAQWNWDDAGKYVEFSFGDWTNKNTDQLIPTVYDTGIVVHELSHALTFDLQCPLEALSPQCHFNYYCQDDIGNGPFGNCYDLAIHEAQADYFAYVYNEAKWNHTYADGDLEKNNPCLKWDWSKMSPRHVCNLEYYGFWDVPGGYWDEEPWSKYHWQPHLRGNVLADAMWLTNKTMTTKVSFPEDKSRSVSVFFMNTLEAMKSSKENEQVFLDNALSIVAASGNSQWTNHFKVSFGKKRIFPSCVNEASIFCKALRTDISTDLEKWADKDANSPPILEFITQSDGIAQIPTYVEFNSDILNLLSNNTDPFRNPSSRIIQLYRMLSPPNNFPYGYGKTTM
ncbi:MAG: hypothetical protein Kow0090_11600 [Myxococcota bacterium]